MSDEIIMAGNNVQEALFVVCRIFSVPERYMAALFLLTSFFKTERSIKN